MITINEIISDLEGEYNLLIDARLFPILNRLLKDYGFMLAIQAKHSEGFYVRLKPAK